MVAVVAVLYGLTALVDMIYHYLPSKARLGILLSLWVLIPLPAIIYVHMPIKGNCCHRLRQYGIHDRGDFDFERPRARRINAVPCPL